MGPGSAKGVPQLLLGAEHPDTFKTCVDTLNEQILVLLLQLAEEDKENEFSQVKCVKHTRKWRKEEIINFKKEEKKYIL